MLASCRFFIVILPLLCVTTHNAPVSLQEHKVLAKLSDKTQEFYCTSVQLKNLAKFMVQVNT